MIAILVEEKRDLFTSVFICGSASDLDKWLAGGWLVAGWWLVAGTRGRVQLPSRINLDARVGSIENVMLL